MSNQCTIKNYIDSLSEQKNALIESIAHSYMSKKSQFEIMLDKCKNKKRESIGNHLNII